jgi:hypothetical protein
VRRDEFDAALRERRIELVGLVGVVPNEPFGRVLHQPVGSGDLDERDFMWCGTVNVNSDGPSITIGDRHDLRTLASLRRSHAGPAFLGGRETAVDEGLPQVQVRLERAA